MEIVQEFTGASPVFVTETRLPVADQAVRDAFVRFMVNLDDSGRAAVVAELRRRKQFARPAARPALVMPTPKRTPVRQPLVDTPESRSAARAWFGLDGGSVPDGEALVAEQQTGRRSLNDSPEARAAARSLFGFGGDVQEPEERRLLMRVRNWEDDEGEDDDTDD